MALVGPLLDEAGDGIGGLFDGGLLASLSGPVNLPRDPGRHVAVGPGLLPTPTFTRGNWSVPRWAMMFFRPLWPPAEPLRRMRSLPWGRETSSEMTRTRSGGTL